MREYGQIQSAFWQSEDAALLSDRGKLLVSYMLTGPHTNGVGCFRLTDGYLLDDLKWSPETVTETLSELFQIGFAIRLEGVVFIPKFLHWNRIINGNIAKARFGDWESISKGKAKSFAARAMLEFSDLWSESHRSILETVSQTVTETLSELFRNPFLKVENQNPTPPHPTPPQNIPLARTTKTKRAKRPAVDLQGFDAFYAAYPRKVAKPAALKAFTKLAPDAALQAVMLDAVRKQSASEKWRFEREFIPYPATWINGRRWEDVVEAPAPVGNGHGAETKPREYHTAPRLDDPALIAGVVPDKQKTDQIIRDLGRKLRVS